MHNKRGAADFTTQTQTGRNGLLIVAHFRKHEQRDAARGVARCCNEARPLKSRARANTRRTPPNAPPARLQWEHPPKCRPAARIEPSRDLTTMICTLSVRGKTAWRASIRIGRSYRPRARSLFGVVTAVHCGGECERPMRAVDASGRCGFEARHIGKPPRGATRSFAGNAAPQRLRTKR